MKISIKKTLIKEKTTFLIYFFVILFVIPGFSSAEMILLSNSELGEVTGTGIIAFSMTDDIARIDLEIETGMYSNIDSMKLGYYDDGASSGWDQDWTNITIGSDSQELVVSGLFFQVVYSDINNPDARGISQIIIGTNNATGTIGGEFNNYSGSITDTGGGVIINGHREQPGFSQIELDHSNVSVVFDSNGGYTFHADNAIVN